MKQLLYQSEYIWNKGKNLLSELYENGSTFKIRLDDKYIGDITNELSNTDTKHYIAHRGNRNFWEPPLVSNLSQAGNFAIVKVNEKFFIYAVTQSANKIKIDVSLGYVEIFDETMKETRSNFTSEGTTINRGLFSISKEFDNYGFRMYIYRYFSLIDIFKGSFNNGKIQDHINDNLDVYYQYDERIRKVNDQLYEDLGYALRYSNTDNDAEQYSKTVRTTSDGYEENIFSDWQFVVERFNEKFSPQFYNHVIDINGNHILSKSELELKCSEKTFYPVCSSLNEQAFNPKLLKSACKTKHEECLLSNDYNQCMKKYNWQCELLQKQHLDDYCDLPQYENQINCSTQKFCSKNNNYLIDDGCIRRPESDTYRKEVCKQFRPTFENGRIRVTNIPENDRIRYRYDGDQAYQVDVEDQVIKSCIMHWNEDPSFDQIKDQSIRHNFVQLRQEDVNTFTNQCIERKINDKVKMQSNMCQEKANQTCSSNVFYDEDGNILSLSQCVQRLTNPCVNLARSNVELTQEEIEECKQEGLRLAQNKVKIVGDNLVKQKLNDLCIIPEYARSPYKKHSCTSSVCLSEVIIDSSKSQISNIKIDQGC